MINRLKFWRMLLVVLIVGGLLSSAGLAFAQSSSAFDLGCWGTLTSGGGQRQSGSFLLYDATGQTAVGEASSGQFRLRAGYIQNWATVQSSAAIAAHELMPDGGESNRVFLPIIQNVIRIVRPCSF